MFFFWNLGSQSPKWHGWIISLWPMANSEWNYLQVANGKVKPSSYRNAAVTQWKDPILTSTCFVAHISHKKKVLSTFLLMRQKQRRNQQTLSRFLCLAGGETQKREQSHQRKGSHRATGSAFYNEENPMKGWQLFLFSWKKVHRLWIKQGGERITNSICIFLHIDMKQVRRSKSTKKLEARVSCWLLFVENKVHLCIFCIQHRLYCVSMADYQTNALQALAAGPEIIARLSPWVSVDPANLLRGQGTLFGKAIHKGTLNCQRQDLMPGKYDEEFDITKFIYNI